MDLLVVHNPAAGRWKLVAPQLNRALRGHNVTVVHTDRQHQRVRALNPHSYDRIIAVGGDGTVNAVAQWILSRQSQTPLAVVPTGSANLLARTFKIPTTISRACKLAVTGTVTQIDVGKVNDQWMVVAAGIGQDAWAVTNTRSLHKRLFGFGAYFISLWQSIRRVNETNVSLTIDGQRLQQHAKTLFIMNFGKFLGIPLGPDISFTDGKFSLAIIRPIGWSDYPIMLARLLGRRFSYQQRLQYYAFQKLKIEYNGSLPLQIDGDAHPATSPIEVTVVPKALSLVVAK